MGILTRALSKIKEVTGINGSNETDCDVSRSQALHELKEGIASDYLGLRLHRAFIEYLRRDPHR